MISAYDKNLTYSYVEGFFPTFELIKYQKDNLINIYVHSSSLNSDGLRKLKNMVDEKYLIYSDKAFNIAKTKENAHVLAVFKKNLRELNIDDDHLVLVNPSDMGNLGNSMRSLLAFGFHNLAIITPCADIFNPKVIRASMGSIFHINIETFFSFDDYLNKYKRDYYPFILQTDNTLSSVKFNHNCALVFGNEATGLPTSLHNENSVKIEQSDEVDSLNLTTSIAIGLYELKKQRNLLK